MTNLAAINSDWRDIGDVSLDVIEAILRERKSPMLDKAGETNEAARPHSSLFWAQAAFENQFQTTGIILKPTDYNPVALRPEKYNDPGPHGSGVITSPDGGQFLRFRSDADAAREWKRRITSPTYKGTGPYIATTTLASYIAVYSPSGDVHPITGVPNEDTNYLGTVTTMLRRFAEAAGQQPPEDTGMATMRAHNFVGGRRAVYLPSWIPVNVRIVNHSRVRSWSPFTNQTKSTYHDTGNPRTNAEGEYRWLAGGRQGGVVGGYQFIFDDKQLIQTGVLNERSWHAGSPRGNESFGAEHAFGGSVVWSTSLEIGMALHGGLLEMQDRNPDNDAVMHQFWTGKYCSAQILNRGVWNAVKAGIKRYWNLARAARNGQQPSVPDPGSGSAVYADPVMPRYPDGAVWDGARDMVENNVKFEAQAVTAKTTVNLRRRQWASTESLDTGPVIPEGSEVKLLGWVAGELVSGVSEWWIGESGSRLWAGGIDVEPKADPDYGQQPEEAPSLHVVNGRIYYELLDPETGDLGRKIRVVRDGNLRRWADTSSEVTGTVEPGEDIVFNYWTRGESVQLTLPGGEQVDEPIWYAKDLHAGDRMWAGLSSDRPD